MEQIIVITFKVEAENLKSASEKLDAILKPHLSPSGITSYEVTDSDSALTVYWEKMRIRAVRRIR